MLLIPLLAGFALLISINVATFRNLHRLRTPWPRCAKVLALIGSLVGLWLGFAFVYQPAPDLKIQGWPFPILVFLLENGRWVDYVGMIWLVGPFNALLVETLCLLPISVAIAVTWLRQR